MIIDLLEFARKAKDHQAENKKFLQSLKKADPRKTDEQFHRLHEEVFSHTDCLSCANCCKTTSPIVKERDVERLAKELRLRPSDVIAKYLRAEKDGTYIMRTAPCPFLGSDNYCSVYESRPAACREYPHTDRRKMVQLLDLTWKNTLVCPAVLEMVETLKKEKGFE